MDADTRRAFDDVKDLIKSLGERHEKVVSGETPCAPAVQIAKLNGKIKTLRLLWIPIILALLLLALKTIT